MELFDMTPYQTYYQMKNKHSATLFYLDRGTGVEER